MRIQSLVIFFLAIGAVCCQQLRYALLTAGPLTGGFDSSGAVPAIELAEEMINADRSILPSYNLTHTPVLDTLCDRTISLNQYFDTISPPNPIILGLLGCGCSPATTPVAEIVQHNSISLISYSSSSIELSNRRRFPNFFRTYPSGANFTPAKVTLIKYYGWRRVVFITQEEGLFTESLERVRGLLEGLGVEVVSKTIPSTIPISGLRSPSFFFQEGDYRVFFINAFANIGRQIICEAYLRGLTYPKYMWLTYGWYQGNWWTEEVNPEPANCTDDQLAEFLKRSVALELFPRLNDSNAMTDTGITPGEFESVYRARLRTPQAMENNYTYTFVATVAYDALWTLALALNRTSEMVQSLTREEILNRTQCEGSDESSGTVWELVSLENFTYSNQLMGCIVRWNLERTDFVGVSGTTEFDSVGSRISTIVDYFQYQMLDNTSSLSRVYFGYLSGAVNGSGGTFVYVSGENNDTVFPVLEGGIPLDGTPIPQILTYSPGLVVPYYILVAAGLVFCTACFIFNVSQRNKKVVKLTSPNINYLIIIGSFLNYISIFFRIMPSTDFTVNEARCYLSAMLNTIGYSLAFAAIVVKMGRVYHIFHNPSLAKKNLSDWKLVLIALSIASVGTLIAVLQVAVPLLAPTPALENVTEFSSENELGVKIQFKVYQCFPRTAQTIWLGVTFAYLALLQIIGIILAIQTRKVKIKLLNDSKYIAALIYISSIALVTIMIITVVPLTLINVVEGVFSGCVLVATTIFLVLVFIPKMISLYRDPTGQFVLSETGTSSVISNAAAGLNLQLTNPEREREFTQMQERIAALEGRLRQYENGQSSVRADLVVSAPGDIAARMDSHQYIAPNTNTLGDGSTLSE